MERVQCRATPLCAAFATECSARCCVINAPRPAPSCIRAALSRYKAYPWWEATVFSTLSSQELHHTSTGDG